MRWLRTATPDDVARLTKHLKTGRFGISGFEYNTTPLCSAEGLARQLYHVRTLREKIGADIRTAHQHDVTGLPWTAVDLLLDSRIELLIMGINLHLGVTLYCPDTPMVQIGNFQWAKKQDAIPRQANPVLLAWPLNNYWETNFRASQPGTVEFRYTFVSHGPFDPVRAMLEGQQTCNPPVTHLVLDDDSPRQGKFLVVQGDRVVVMHVKPAEDLAGIIARVVNLGDNSTTERPNRRAAADRKNSPTKEKDR